MATQLFINGQFTDPQQGKTLDVIDPATEQVFDQLAAATAEDVELAVNAARASFDSGVWQNQTAEQRGKVLRKVSELINERLDEIAALEVKDNGKPFPEAQWDVEDAAFCFTYYAELAEQMAASPDELIDVGDDRFSSKVVKDPVGVVGAIVPWNFPLLMAVWKVAPALAAGCSIVLKPSELCSLSCVELAKIIKEAGVPDGVFNLITGLGTEAGAPIAEHPLVDKLAFTGSVPTGSRIMAAAAKDIRTVSLELGGKSPFIIFDDCDIEKAVEWIMFGIFWNQGQVCSATSRVLVHEEIFESLMVRLCIEAEKITTGPGMEEGVLLGPLVSAGQYNKVLGFIADARAAGIEPVFGGERPAGLDTGYYLQPTIYADVPTDATIWKEEVFGPVVCVNKFASEEEAIALANDSEFGLGGAVMSDDLQRCDRVAKALKAGIIWVNCSQPTFAQAPWGGYKKSGIGRELGRWGIENYFETKQITAFNKDERWGWYIK
ncbi:MAG: aldehyde dehydrogenase [Oceanospirillaceae bacterium]|nr:aldehyde dehydrogenase [Oceanospirillaceae bacterium]MBT12852.1 aldehyde dehydrogenase [Oceanospirillaceae bacterium]